MALSRINRIARRVEGRYRFAVELTDGTTTTTVELPASALRTYAAFQTGILRAAGIMFRDDQFALGRGVGATYWQDEIERHLQAAEVHG